MHPAHLQVSLSVHTLSFLILNSLCVFYSIGTCGDTHIHKVPDNSVGRAGSTFCWGAPENPVRLRDLLSESDSGTVKYCATTN